MPPKNIKLAVGFITYGKLTAKYLPYFLPSLTADLRGIARDYIDYFKIFVVDNSEEQDNENIEYIKKNYPEIEIERAGKNIGFARAYNKMINKAADIGAEHFLALNPDMIIGAGMVKEMADIMDNDKKAAAVAPKILKWDFVNNKKTNIIDSYGIKITRDHCFFDDRQGQVDAAGDDIREVFGFTGAAVLLRIKALRDVSCKALPPNAQKTVQQRPREEFFDELMFMYKEDCDLSYRLRLAGWKIVFAPTAVAYHARRASAKGENVIRVIKNRLNKGKQIKKWSFLNHCILLSKYKNLPFSFKIKLAAAWYQFKSFIFIVLFEQYLLKEYFTLWKLKDAIEYKRKQLKIRIDVKEIEKFM